MTLIGGKGLRSKKKSHGGFCFQSSSSVQDKSIWQLLNNLSHDVSGIFNVKEIKCVLVKCYREITSQANLLARILVQGWLQSKGYDVSWNNYYCLCLISFTPKMALTHDLRVFCKVPLCQQGHVYESERLRI